MRALAHANQLGRTARHKNTFGAEETPDEHLETMVWKAQ
jgi:hypothetical protein